jgi:hypothetical protein
MLAAMLASCYDLASCEGAGDGMGKRLWLNLINLSHLFLCSVLSRVVTYCVITEPEIKRVAG